MDEGELRAFLVKSNEAGYAGGDEKKWLREADRSTTIAFERDYWKSHDNFFGGEPYGGRMVVSYQDRPVWMMVYYGWVVQEVAPEEVYGVLKNALRHMPADSPFRGPERYKSGRFTYTNHW